MPTGVHLTDPRQQLFDAAERVLLRDGAAALTSRAVTDEAGCAKGVLHRHFADFDAFLTELVLDRSARLTDRATALTAAAGTGTVADNLSNALVELFGPVPLAIIPLITFRDEVRNRLHAIATEHLGSRQQLAVTDLRAPALRERYDSVSAPFYVRRVPRGGFLSRIFGGD